MEYNVTMVSAFIDIGEFGKGARNIKRDHRIYQNWSWAYSAIYSPLVFYTDSPSFADHMQHVRQKQPDLTKIILVNRTSLWAFQLRDAIAAIYRAGYPKHYPNTVYPDYTCVTHAKFEFVKDAILNNYFNSRHVVWVDVGYFRDMWTRHNKTTAFTMHLLANLDPKRVLCTQVGAPNFTMAWRDIFWKNINWVAGGFFLAKRQVMVNFVLQYQRAVELFLRLNQSQVEQHVLYSIYTGEGREIVKPTIELQPIVSRWFDLGFNSLVPVNDSSLS
ncbi:uncharacterized protein LOC112577102 isoform X2 [Pomacea canaliculata]|nr:uncharacterized protein LOC112577102 isoform X2 [Pomacea canaliculata]